LDYGVEVSVEGRVINRQRVDRVDLHIDEFGRRRVVGLRQRIPFQGLGVGCLIGVGATVLGHGPECKMDAIGVGLQHDIAVGRHVALVTRWQDQIFATFTLVRPGGADIGNRHLPSVHDGAKERGLVTRRRHVNDDGPVLGA